MDSLLANYASSDEEDQQEPQRLTPPKTTSSSTLFSSLPTPKSSSSSSSSSLFQSLPQPKQHSSTTWSNSSETVSLPHPKSQIDEPQPKRVVQFKPPIIPLPNPNELDEDDDEEQEEQNRRRKLESSTQTSSVKSFLSSIPAPKYTATLGVQASSGSGRRSIIETEAPASAPAPAPNSSGSSDVPVDQSAGNYENYQYDTDQYAGYYGNYGSGIEPEAGVADYGNNGDAYASYGGYGDHGNNWGDGLAATAPEVSGVSESVMRFTGKRGRHEVPAEVIEVKQDELIKNRPREDQVKLTGIAFGPAYQPVSAKGKPSKLHKRKHQIGSLYFDMKQNETKLAERRAKGMLTKAETQAKYGW
ncbi:flocculation protein FLO11 [Abrus precatorius]|uniref:Flocculation protein FLO11 n=1 Tax=Abrus precatorius TaxID=3816 RepID=A0A8B8JMU0_ABRPR|nr:flocculation protein FLO11 [Abrus precatorius]